MSDKPTDATADMPDWLREAWPKVSAMLAVSISRQRPDDRAEIERSLEEGHPIDWMLDGERVMFGVGGTAFCEMTMAAITGVPSTARSH